MFDDVLIDRSTTAERVAEALRERILRGDIEPGTPLREVALSQSLAVSRSTVREAMQLLTAEGLLTRSLYRGVVVTELTADDVTDIYRARRLLELGGVDAMRHADRALLDDLAGTLARWRDAADRREAAVVVDLHLAFHGQLVGLLQSKRLNALFSSLMADLRLALATVDRRIENFVDHFESHQILVDYLQTGHVDECHDMLAVHLDAAETTVLTYGRLRDPETSAPAQPRSPR